MARVPERDIERWPRACFSNILCTERIYSCTTARNCLVVGSYSQDANARGCKADRARFSHADVVQSTVLEDHHCLCYQVWAVNNDGPSMSVSAWFRVGRNLASSILVYLKNEWPISVLRRVLVKPICFNIVFWQPLLH